MRPLLTGYSSASTPAETFGSVHTLLGSWRPRFRPGATMTSVPSATCRSYSKQSRG